MLCRKLKCSWQELRDMPEDTVELWEAVISGEEHAQLMKRAAGTGG